MTVTIDPFAAGWCYCGRAYSPTNEKVGGSCRGCLTEWVNEPDQDPDPRPVAYFPAALESECQGCGQQTWARDLCASCDPTTTDPGRPV